MDRIKPKKAIAVKYDEYKDDAPKVLGKGQNHLADKIIEVARKHNVYIKEDPELTNILYKLDIGAEIPEELYQVVAEILAFIYRVRKRWLQ